MISIEKGKQMFKGTPMELTKDYILLTHAFIDGVMPYLPAHEKEAFKVSICTAIMEEWGMDFLSKHGLVGDVQKVDLSSLSNLKKEADDETNR